MSAGTIKLTNGSTAVVGTSTTFTTDLKSGDVITTTIGGVFYTLFVDTVTSNTALTLSDAFTGPTTTGAAYVAVPQMTLNRITAALAAQTAEAVRRVLQENANWQAFYSGSGDITVTLPNGTPTGVQVSGPSWAKLSGVANTAWIDRGQLATDANLNTMNPSTTEGEWSKSSSTGLTTANGFPAGAGVGTLKVNNGGRYQGQHIYTDYLGNQWVRALTAAWNGTDGPWSTWVNTATFSLRSTLVTGSATDLNTYTTADQYGTLRVAGSTAPTAAMGWPYDSFAGTVEIVQGYGSGAQQIALSQVGNLFSRSWSGGGTALSNWTTWLEIGRQPRTTAFVGNVDTLFDIGEHPTTSATTGLPTVPGTTATPGGLINVRMRASGAYTQEWTVFGSNPDIANQKFTRTYWSAAWQPWREDLDDKSMYWVLGYGPTAMGRTTLDWQNDSFSIGESFYVLGSNMTNIPTGMDATTLNVDIHVRCGDGTGTRIVDVVYSTTTTAGYRKYELRIAGSVGARTINVRQVFTSADIVPIANGGTGGTTQAAARTGLGLKGASILDVGTVAGTVAAGDDSRLGTLGGKTGGNVTTAITITGGGNSFVAGPDGANNEGTNKYRRMVHGFINAAQYSWIDSYLTSANMLTRIITVSNTTYRTFNFYDTGSATCDGTWQNGSDERHKYNIKCVPDALTAVLSWRGATYTKKDGGDEVGLIAQDVEKVCPDAVFNAGRREFSDGTVIEDFKTLNTAGAAAAYHTEAIKALFGLVKLAIDDPEAARAAIAAIESEGLVATQQDDSKQSDEVESHTPDTSADEENQSDTQQ